MKSSIGCQLSRFFIFTKLSSWTSARVGTRALSCLFSTSSPHTQLLPHHYSKSHSQYFVGQKWYINQQLRTAMSLARQNFAEECEAGINRQINLELYASYVYQSMAFHFDRSEVALPGFHKFFNKASDEEREHAEKLMKYQNMRGGRILLQDVKKPDVDEWGSGLEAMTSALKLEKSVNQALIDLHKIAENNGDAQFCDFLEGEYLKEQVESIKEISEYVTQLTKVGPGLGEYQFDKETLQEKFE